MKIEEQKDICRLFDRNDIALMLASAFVSRDENREIGMPICKVDNELKLNEDAIGIGSEYGVRIPRVCPEGSTRVGEFHTHIREPTFSFWDVTNLIISGLDIICQASTTNEEAEAICIKVNKNEHYNEIRERLTRLREYTRFLYDRLTRYVNERRLSGEEAVRLLASIDLIASRIEDALIKEAMEKGVIPRGEFIRRGLHIRFEEHCLKAKGTEVDP